MANLLDLLLGNVALTNSVYTIMKKPQNVILAKCLFGDEQLL